MHRGRRDKEEKHHVLRGDPGDSVGHGDYWGRAAAKCSATILPATTYQQHQPLDMSLSLSVLPTISASHPLLATAKANPEPFRGSLWTWAFPTLPCLRFKPRAHGKRHPGHVHQRTTAQSRPDPALWFAKRRPRHASRVGKES